MTSVWCTSFFKSWSSQSHVSIIHFIYNARMQLFIFKFFVRSWNYTNNIQGFLKTMCCFSGTCEVKNMTSVDLRTSVYYWINLQEGLQYFFTVEATNGAGLKDVIYSDGITVDNSPPVIEGIYHSVENNDDSVPQLMIQNDGRYLEFYWKKPYDTESGIWSLKWCAETKNNSCNIVSPTSVDPEDTSVKHTMSPLLASGTVVYVMLVVTNGARITSTVVSRPLLIDTTPPSLGNVTLEKTAETAYFRKRHSITATWSGFVDDESHLSHFEWAICEACETDKCVNQYVNVGLDSTTNIDMFGFKYGISYVVIVRAFNEAGLFSEACSKHFILDGVNPSPGTVFDGLERQIDREFQSSTTRLSANWSPFKSVNSRIVDYEICAGTEPGTCDVSGFVSLGVNFKGSITGLSLEDNGRYFVTVRATSESGYNTTATSNGVRVDSTPPLGGKVRDGQTFMDIDYQAADTFIFANWDEFQDEESDVSGYTWCAGTGKGICDIISETSVGDRTSASQQILPPLPGGIPIFVTVSTLNNAGQYTKVSSDGFKVDDTQPLLSKVSLLWSTSLSTLLSFQLFRHV